MIYPCILRSQCILCLFFNIVVVIRNWHLPKTKIDIVYFLSNYTQIKNFKMPQSRPGFQLGLIIPINSPQISIKSLHSKQSCSHSGLACWTPDCHAHVQKKNKRKKFLRQTLCLIYFLSRDEHRIYKINQNL